MSTRSNIFIKIKTKDKNKKLFYDPAKMTAGLKFHQEKELEKWTKENDVILDKNYAYVYCHSDGYPSGLGETLLTFFNDYEKALNLISAGALCYVDITSEAFMDSKTETSNEITINSPLFIEYVYLFDNDKWYILKTNSYLNEPITYPFDKFTLLEDYFKKFPND